MGHHIKKPGSGVGYWGAGQDKRTGIFVFLGAFPALRAGNRAIHTNSSALPQVKPPVFPLLSLARSVGEPFFPMMTAVTKLYTILCVILEAGRRVSF
jgi:hypothetical protein